ncbi:MAG TPA: hypothetical protein VE396_11430 [Xanthobacteraceae bacterium]|jgi:hypothetical protein|nr:hypothetical protein [Xanthobacteraceae bacterium]
MSNQTRVQSGLAAGPPSDAEYNAVYAAVSSTERGRWFLAEYASRNRCADTDLVIAAIARIEAAIREGAAPQSSTELSRELTAAAATIESTRVKTGEHDEVSANVSTQVPSPPDGILNAEAQKDKDYSDAVAMIAASLTALAGNTALKEPEHDDVPGVFGGAAAEADDAKATPPPRPAPQDNAQRWHIEAPDFVFDNGREDKISSFELPVDAMPAQPGLSGRHFRSEPADDACDSFAAPPHIAAEPAPAAASSVPTPADITTLMGEPVVEPKPELNLEPIPEPAPDFAAPLDVGPPPEISRPQLRIANSAMPAHPRATRSNSLSVTDALSDEEVIALFG